MYGAPFAVPALFALYRPVEAQPLPPVLAAQGGLLVLSVPLGTLAGGPLVTLSGGRGTLLLSAPATITVGALAAILARPRRTHHGGDDRGGDGRPDPSGRLGSVPQVRA